MSAKFEIRDYHASDLFSLYRICLQTGAEGGDATGLIDDEVLGHIYAAPYAVIEPELSFILTRDGVTCGYILGTAGSKRFEQLCEADWWPVLRARYPLPADKNQTRDAALIRDLHQGYQAPSQSETYPAHLHIDLLPEGQGQGQGRRLIEHFCEALRVRNVPGVHLEVGKANSRAVAFYQSLGFELLESKQGSMIFGMSLRA